MKTKDYHRILLLKRQPHYLNLATSHLSGNKVQCLLASPCDLSAALARLFRNLEVVKSGKNVSNKAASGVLVNLGACASSVSPAKSVLKGANTSTLSEVHLANNGSCESGNGEKEKRKRGEKKME